MMWMILTSMVTGTIGEIMCKRMSSDPRTVYWLYPIVLICWGVCGPLLWTNIYKTRGLAEGAILYNVLQLVLVGFVGIVLFKEPLTPRFILGTALAAAAIYVMQGGTK